MLDFQLFRIRALHTLPLFTDATRTPSDILKETVLAFSGMALSKDAIWRIGNVHAINGDGAYLRLGKTTESTLEVFEDGGFQDQVFETAPYTHVVIDFNLEVCAIAKKPQLAPRTTTIAKRFRLLLNRSNKARELGMEFEIDEITDPHDFIFYLNQAFAVSKFEVTFKRPNAWDVNEDFIKPSQRMLENLGGEQGKTKIEGKELKTEVLEELARSIASTGDEAAAWLQMKEGEKKKVKKVLKENPVYLRHEDLLDDKTKRSFLVSLKERYAEIRKNNINKDE